MCEKSEFSETPLGIHGLHKKNRPDFINSFNAFWTWENDIKLWSELGRPDPFDDSDISIAAFVKANLGI